IYNAVVIIVFFCFFLFHVIAGAESFLHQEKGLMSANIGDTVTLRCFYKGESAVTSSWYKQSLGDKLNLISTMYMFSSTGQVLYDEFKDENRFSIEGGQGQNHLRISNVELTDSATYFCGVGYSNMVEFGQGAILNVKERRGNISVLQQPVSESVHSGDSVTLNCTINTGTCEGEHSVYWFRHDSGESPPGIIYTNGDRSGQCMKRPESGSPTQSCVYNLPKRNLSLSDTGTYYCAVASCGEILFGNGTNLEVKVALGVSIILIIVLTCIIYKMNMMTCRQCSGQSQLL
uniref:Ig-like domain-containing protein n=1 Tax=Esox lucius TaxID=8010 RepID=A0A3P8Z3Y8_ESOLU